MFACDILYCRDRVLTASETGSTEQPSVPERTKVCFAHSRVQIFRKAQLLFRARSCASLLFHRTHFPMKEQRKCPEGTSLTMKTYMVKKSFGALSFPVPHLITAGGKCFPITLLSTLPAQSVHRYCLFSYIQHLPVLFPHY